MDRSTPAAWRDLLRPVALLLVALAAGAAAGGAAYVLPAAVTAIDMTGQRVDPSPATATAIGTTGRRLDPSPGVGGRAGAPRPVPDGRPFTVLLLGSDDDSKFAAERILTQSMILVRVDPAAKRATMLSIPRDLWVPLSTGQMAKIDAAYEYGGASAAIATVTKNFGVRIDDYVWIGLKGMIDVVDAVSGVDLIATNPVLDDYYPADVGTVDPYGYARVAILPGPQHLDGAYALQYVRSRHGDLLSDFGRSRRQQQLLLAILERIKHLSVADAPALVGALQGEVRTSMGLDRIQELIPLAAAYGQPGTIEQLVLLPPYTRAGTVGDQSVVLPDWSQIRPLVREHFPE